ncbi:septum site-determining protein MinC [Pontibacillus litoralis]|uniref:Probable septum site-determining protein MinC n=1 Tax=Pontibacillus litoralis JSM 072002 TaxID=1385512 RepID=A0A0A5GCV9_9BACI|nr:septum site-determining protein MinC [Pontibacillus litoralis]KGX89013.1 septation inhibitor protein [Pontibacillus litoralis JSM 072002]
MSIKKQIVSIKGTKEGLTLHIDDTSSFDEVMKELENKLVGNEMADGQPEITVRIQLGKRYITDEQQEQIVEKVRSHHKLVVESIESDVLTKEEALEWKRDTQTTSIFKVIRSGQVVEIRGDVLLIGDVNPGGKIVATGNIFIMGNLRGVAHAGVDGNADAVIAASYMKPSQLRIANHISRSPDYEEVAGTYMECGYIDEEQGKIMVDRLQLLYQKRPDLRGIERRMLNG